MAATERRAVRTTIGIDRPSTPKKYSTLINGIHWYCSTNCGSDTEVSKRMTVMIARARVARVTPRATWRLRPPSAGGSKENEQHPGQGQEHY